MLRPWLGLWAVVQVIILRRKISRRGDKASDGGSPGGSRRFAFDEIYIRNFVDAYNQYKLRKALEPAAKIIEIQDIPALREEIKELKKRFDWLSQAVFSVPSGTAANVHIEEQSQKGESTIGRIGSLWTFECAVLAPPTPSLIRACPPCCQTRRLRKMSRQLECEILAMQVITAKFPRCYCQGQDLGCLKRLQRRFDS
jgi:hypothetical protein